MNAPAPQDDPKLAGALERLSRAMGRIAARIMENEERAHEEQARLQERPPPHKKAARPADDDRPDHAGVIRGGGEPAW